jgi:hypothetical protein
MLQEAAVDLMVVGNWVHDSGDVRGTRQRLLQLEMEANARIFPSIDYLECFTHKERYYPRLARFCRRKRREQTGAFFVGDECDVPDDGRDDGHDGDSDESDSLREHVHDAHTVV